MKTLKAWRFLVPALAAGFILSACGLRLWMEQGKLDERLIKYHDLYRWRNYEAASSYLLPAVRKDFLAAAEAQHGDLNVAEYEIQHVAIGPSGREATVLVSRSFFKMPSATLQQQNLEQRWLLVQGDWYLSGPPY